jgi:hypothetical protein
MASIFFMRAFTSDPFDEAPADLPAIKHAACQGLAHAKSPGSARLVRIYRAKSTQSKSRLCLFIDRIAYLMGGPRAG